MTFDQIYQTIDGSFNPKERSLSQIGVILKEVDDLSKHPRYNIVLDHNYLLEQMQLNTVIARLLHEVNTIQTDDQGQFWSSSEGIERAIAQIKTFKILSYTPPTENSEIQFIQISGALNAYKKYLIHTAREGLVFTHKKIIYDKLYMLNSKPEKLNYLNSSLITMRQSKNSWDPYQYDQISNYLELEIHRWELMSDSRSNEIEFNSCKDLQEFVTNLLKDKLNHNIKYDEGFRVFWRDEKCISNPKHEPEIQPYIKSILKPYCDLKNVKISREVSIANGSIDLSFSYLSHTVCLEVKKAEHQDILNALSGQLTEYMLGEQTCYGIYLVLWYKNETSFTLPSKYRSLEDLISEIIIPNNSMDYQVLGIDCNKPISPSKLKIKSKR
jgi:hypothetical protein